MTREIYCKGGRCFEDNEESRFDEAYAGEDIIKKIDHDLIKKMIR